MQTCLFTVCDNLRQSGYLDLFNNKEVKVVRLDDLKKKVD